MFIFCVLLYAFLMFGSTAGPQPLVVEMQVEDTLFDHVLDQQIRDQHRKQRYRESEQMLREGEERIERCFTNADRPECQDRWTRKKEELEVLQAKWCKLRGGSGAYGCSK